MPHGHHGRASARRKQADYPPHSIPGALLGKQTDGDRHRGTNERRFQLLLEDSKTAPDASRVPIIDEALRTARTAKRPNRGKAVPGGIDEIDDGAVSVGSLWADERSYYPLQVEPYPPAYHLEEGKADHRFRTKPRIASDPVEVGLERRIPFRAVVAHLRWRAPRVQKGPGG